MNGEKIEKHKSENGIGQEHERQFDLSEEFKMYSELKKLSCQMNYQWLKIGQLLYLISKDNAFRKLNPECTSFNQFIADPELGLSKTDSYDCRKAYRIFIEENSISSERLARIGKAKLIIIMRYVGKILLEQLLMMAEGLSKCDLIEELAGFPVKGTKRDPVEKVVQEQVYGPRHFYCLYETELVDSSGLVIVKPHRPDFYEDPDGKYYVEFSVPV